MLAKKVTALFVSAALVLTLLAGCGGSKALSQVIADLLSGLYTNVDVEVDSDLTAALKKAGAEGGTGDEILTRLGDNLGITGRSRNLTRLGDGQQGDHGVDLVFQTGSDPDAAARSALAQWASVFGSLPDDGSYRAHISMIEAENGYYIAVDVEVLKAGTPDKGETDPDPEPDPGYRVEDGTYFVTNATGLIAWADHVRAGNWDTNCTLTADINLAGEEWTPIGTDDNNAYNGIFDGKDYAISNLTVNQPDKNYAGLFGCLGSGGKVQNLTLENVNISGAFYAGSVVGTNFGTVSGCTASGNITGTESCIGGVVGQNRGTVTGCTVSGDISSNQYTGGVVGENFGTVSACYHATGDVTGNINYVGGVVGWNYYGTVTACYHVNGNVTATYNWVGSVAGYNGGVGSVTACYWNDSPDPGIGYDNGSGQATKVDSTDVTWKEAVDAMNTALKNAGSEWRYELKDGNSLPTLKKQ